MSGEFVRAQCQECNTWFARGDEMVCGDCAKDARIRAKHMTPWRRYEEQLCDCGAPGVSRKQDSIGWFCEPCRAKMFEGQLEEWRKRYWELAQALGMEAQFGKHACPHVDTVHAWAVNVAKQRRAVFNWENAYEEIGKRMAAAVSSPGICATTTRVGAEQAKKPAREGDLSFTMGLSELTEKERLYVHQAQTESGTGLAARYPDATKPEAPGNEIKIVCDSGWDDEP